MATENRPYLELPPQAPDAPPPKPRAAASLIVLRDSPRGMEVLMIRRAERPGDQNSGATVFPGGLLDASDRGHYERCNGLDDAAASARLGLPSDGLHYWVAAVRECFEEAGLLFATNADGHTVDLNALPADEVVALRRALHANQTGMAEVCAQFGRRILCFKHQFRIQLSHDWIGLTWHRRWRSRRRAASNRRHTGCGHKTLN